MNTKTLERANEYHELRRLAATLADYALRTTRPVLYKATAEVWQDALEIAFELSLTVATPSKVYEVAEVLDGDVWHPEEWSV